VPDALVIRCACCGLRHPAPAQTGDPALRRTCVRCAAHTDDTVASVAARESDHASMYSHALIDAQDEAILARGERDLYYDKMHAAYASRELLVQVLSQVEDAHHHRGKRCVCGKRACRVAAAVSDPRVARLIRTYDEVQRTLRELRNANPDGWTEKWDYIDVSLVYPQARRHSGRGRHRATG
jgi:transposase-like protein